MVKIYSHHSYLNTGSCNTDCDCPSCSPFCSNSGFCQNHQNAGRKRILISECLGGLGGGSFGLGYGPGPAYGYAAGPLAFNNNCRDGCFYSKYRDQCVGNSGSICD